jgi:hypothetical protein
MSREHPTEDELSAITQWMYGSYGVELPDWYEPGMVQPELADYHKSVTND